MTAAFSGPDVARAIERAARALHAAREPLNAADARLGDGDTGTMLARASGAILGAPQQDDAPDPATLLRRTAETIAAETGSSLGTLLALGLRACARHLAGRDTVTAADLGAALAAAMARMRDAGGARPGDKTIIDLLDAIAADLGRGITGAALCDTARAVMEDFRPGPCRIGRARLYPEASQGADDPGMRAGVIALEAICAAT